MHRERSDSPILEMKIFIITVPVIKVQESIRWTPISQNPAENQQFSNSVLPIWSSLFTKSPSITTMRMEKYTLNERQYH